MMCMKGGTGFPFAAEISNLGNRDMKNFVLQVGKLCSAQNSAK